MNQVDKDTEMTQADLDVMQALQEYREFKQDTRKLKTRVINTPPSPDLINVAHIRQRIGLSQSDFAARYGFRIRTIQEWEQQRRTPEGSARILLLLIEQRPEVVEEILTLSASSHVTAGPKGDPQGSPKEASELRARGGNDGD